MKKILLLTALIVVPVLSGAQVPSVQDFKVFVPTQSLPGGNREIAVLYAKVADAFAARDYELCLGLLDQIVAIDPNNLTALANAAAIHSLRGITKYNTAIFDTNTATRKLSLESARDEIRRGENDAEKAYDLMGVLARRPEYSLIVDASRKFVLKSR